MRARVSELAKQLEVLNPTAGWDDDVDDRDPPIPLGMLADGDRYFVASGPHARSRGLFSGDATGRISSIHQRGRYAPRTDADGG